MDRGVFGAGAKFPVEFRFTLLSDCGENIPRVLLLPGDLPALEMPGGQGAEPASPWEQ